MKQGIIVLFISLISQLGWAQSATVTGTILFDDGEPVIGAYVLVKGTKVESTSDENGNYTLTNVAYGNYTFVVKSAEIKEKEIEVAINAAAVKINVSTQRHNAHELEEVLISEKSVKKTIQEKGYAANVIETKGIALQSIQTNELLDRSVGVRVRQAGGLGSTVQYSINGLSGNSVRIFIDGISISNYGPSFSLNSIPPTLIERIEVYKGVVPTYLSDDALGGAINIVLKPGATNSLSASYSFGSFNTHQSSVNGNYRDSKSGFTARGSVFQNYSDNNYKVWGNQVYVTGADGKITYVKQERFHDRYRSIGTKADVGFTDVKWADQFFVGALYSNLDRQVQHGATMETVFGNRSVEQSTLMLSTTYTKKSLFTKGLDVSVYASYSDMAAKTIDTIPYMYNWYGEISDFNQDGIPDTWATGAEASNRPTLNKNKEKTYVARTNIAYSINDNNSVGVNYLINDFTRKPYDPLMPAAEREFTDTRDLQKSILGLSYENQAFKQRLKTTLFYKYYTQTIGLSDPVRVNNVLTKLEFEKDINESGFGVAMSYTVIPKVMLTASAENAIRLPVGEEVFGDVALNVDSSYGLEPEKSANVNLGFILGPYAFGKHKIGLTTNVFYRNTKDMIMRAQGREQDISTGYENLQDVLSKGIDAELNYTYNEKLFLTLGASSLEARNNRQFDDNGAQYIHYKSRLRNVPYFTLNNNIRYNADNLLQKGSRTTFYYNFGYVHKFFRNWPSLGGTGKAIIPEQLVHDLGVAYTFPGYRFTVSADAKNILDHQVFDNWALQKPGRSFFIKLNYKLY